VEIITKVATAYGPWAQNPPDAPYISKPTYPTHMLVTCPAGREAQVDMSPVFSHTIPGVALTCTGSRQEVVFVPTAAPSGEQGWHTGTVSAALRLRPVEEGGALTLLDTDVKQVRVNTVGTGDKPVWPPKPTDPPKPPDPPQPPGSDPVAHRPSAPRAVHATSASRRATLFWARPASAGSARIDLYQVRRGISQARNVPATSSRFTFTRLVNGRAYALFVRAHNRVGFSPWVRAVVRPHAPVRPRDYRNCASLNRVYPHGVGKPGAVDKSSGRPVTTFTRSLAVYRLNTESDRDRDGIACEKL
jgi:hypothetical protein